jgi:DNA (cytosine-5)-methyltransferase 1
MAFTFVDLFAGIGGFHSALTLSGGKCVYACEIDSSASQIYENNWNIRPSGDIKNDVSNNSTKIPKHDVLAAGFPCQPFSKSGKQLGMKEERGDLFWSIAKVIELRKPKIVMLENVRNLAGPRHQHEFEIIIDKMRKLGYRISQNPLVISPHQINPSKNGSPQNRERLYILATHQGHVSNKKELQTIPNIDLDQIKQGWEKENWDILKHLDAVKVDQPRSEMQLSSTEITWIETWDDLVQRLKFKDLPIPAFPIWFDYLNKKTINFKSEPHPVWKARIIEKNKFFFNLNQSIITNWKKANPDIVCFPGSRRKLEWQAGQNNSIWDGLIQFRPSGVRVKKANYSPALVALNQTPILGPLKRKISVNEGAYLQGFPPDFDFGIQPASQSFKQLGNAVHVGSAIQLFRLLLDRDRDLIKSNPRLRLLI